MYICYDLPPPELWHERLVLASCACGRGWHIVLTPDFDVFPEHVSLENDDISGFRVGRAFQLPAGLDDGNTYRFRNMPAGEEMAQMRLDAQHAAAALAFPPGAGPDWQPLLQLHSPVLLLALRQLVANGCASRAQSII